MKTNKLIVLLLAASLSISAYAGKNTVQFNAMVSNKKAVEKMLEGQNGVKSAKVNQKTGTIDIVFDDTKTDISQIGSALSSAGIYASPVGENCATKPGGCLNNPPKTTN